MIGNTSEKQNKEPKSIIEKLKGIAVLVIVFGIGELVRIVDSKWILYGFILLLIVLFVISVSLTIKNKLKNSKNANSNIDVSKHTSN